MAGPKKARGFTLVELLVVITIIGMLVSLLLPAIQSAREAGRRNTCQSNMRNAVLGLLNFEQNKKGFPGYAVPLQKSNGRHFASWVVPILPYLERNDLYQNWMLPTVVVNSANKAQFVSQLNVLLCPSNPSPELGDNPLHFVVNTGSAFTATDNDQIAMSVPVDTMKPRNGQNWPEDPNSGVFFNQAQMGVMESPLNGFDDKVRKITVDYISTNDGTSNTLMMTENLQAGTWGVDPNTNLEYTTAFAVRQQTGFCWFLTGLQENTANGFTTSTKLEPGAIGINDMSKSINGFASGKFDATKAAQGVASGIAFARPSASHPGGVNAAFCDGHMRFLNDELDYRVYTQLMTPFQKAVIVDYNMSSVAAGNEVRATATSGGGLTSVVKPWIYILNEADF